MTDHWDISDVAVRMLNGTPMVVMVDAADAGHVAMPWRDAVQLAADLMAAAVVAVRVECDTDEQTQEAAEFIRATAHASAGRSELIQRDLFASILLDRMEASND